MSEYILLMRVKPFFGPDPYVYPGAIFLVEKRHNLELVLIDVHGRHLGFRRNFIEYKGTDLEKVLYGIKD